MILSLKRNWSSERDVFVRGSGFIEGEFYSSKDIVSVFEGVDSVRRFKTLLSKVNGFFAVVINKGNTFIATDHVGSIDLYYGHIKGGKFVSDNEEFIKKRDNNNDKSEIAEIEILANRPGVFGNNTQYPNVKRVRPGEIVSTQYSREYENTYFAEHYYKPERDNTESLLVGKNNINRRLDILINESFDRLVRYADGRKIVVPLTSGYDSLLTLLKLKQKKYDNVLSFTKDDWGNEIEKAKKRANIVGYDWCTPETTHQGWAQLKKDKEISKFFSEVGGISCYKNPSYLLPIRKLVDSGLIDDESLLVPGHTAIDMFKRTPNWISGNNKIGTEDVVSEILRYHDFYKERPSVHIQNKALKRKLRKRLSKSLNIEYSKVEPLLAISTFEQFFWEQYSNGYWTQPTYEYLDLDFWYPLLDKSILEFWSKVHPKMTHRQDVYRSYVKKLYTKITGESLASETQSRRDYLRTKMEKNYIGNKTINIYRKIKEIYDGIEQRLSKNKSKHEYRASTKFGLIGEKNFCKLGLSTSTAGTIIKAASMNRFDIKEGESINKPNDKYSYEYKKYRGIIIK